MDALKYAIENTDLPTLIAELYPESGAQPGKECRCVAVWRGGEKQSVGLYYAGNGVSMYKDFATDKSGNCFHWLMDARNLSPAEAAKFLIDRLNLNSSSTKKGLGKIEIIYDYKDVNGNLIHQTVRYEGKVFRQRRPAPDGGWIWGLRAGTYYKNSMGDWSKNGKGESREFPECETIPYNLQSLLGTRDRNKVAVIVEGEKDAETLIRFDFTGTCNCSGGGNWTKAELANFKGLDVVILGDFDEPNPKTKTRKGVLVAKKLANSLVQGIAKSVSGPVFMPNGFKDISDYVDSGATAEDLQALIYAAEPWEFDTELEKESVPANVVSESKAEKPVIQVNSRFLHEIAEDAIKAIQACNNPPRLYIRSDLLSRVDKNGKTHIMDNASLKGYLDRCARFVTIKTERQIVTPARPPSDLAPDLLSIDPDELGLPELKTVSTVPIFDANGRLITKDGYDAESKTLLLLNDLKGFKFELFPMDKALGIFDDLIVDFPVAFHDIGRAHILVMFLQPFIRSMINGPTPLYLIESPTRGTGKSKLCNALALLVTGQHAPIMTLPRNSEEMEKRITANLLEGHPIILLDNVNQLGGEELAAVLTARVWRGRRLGKSEMIHIINNSQWLSTGNNVDLLGDIARRVLGIRLDAGVEKPEERKQFRHPDLESYILQNRPTIINALLSIAQHAANKGFPKGSKILGGYEDFSQKMGGILEVAEVEGFLDGREYLYEHSDKETTEWKAVCEVWWEQYESRPISPKDLFEICKEKHFLLDLWGGRSDQAGFIRLGIKLSKNRDRIFGKFAIRFIGKARYTKSLLYKLEEIS